MILRKPLTYCQTLEKRRAKEFWWGFAAETENLLANAAEKLKNKNLDMIVANDISRSDVGFGAEDNQVTVVFKGRDIRVFAKDGKR